MIFCCGSNSFGQIGSAFPTNHPVSLHSKSAVKTYEEKDQRKELVDDDVADIQCASTLTVFLHKDGSVSQCGYLNGELFPPMYIVHMQHPLKCSQIACGRKHCLALLSDGNHSAVMSWGIGYFGQLGHNDDSSLDSPHIIHALDIRRTGSRVRSVACGGYHTAALLENNMVFMWGLNKGGQCGAGKIDNVTDPRPVIFPERDVEGDAIGTIKELVLARNHSAVLTNSGRVYVWGESTFGRLGISESNSGRKVYQPTEIGFFRSVPVRALTTGDFHMLALCDVAGSGGVDSGTDRAMTAVYSWGYGADGQTGHSTLHNIRTPRRIEYLDDSQIVSICCGASWSTATSVTGVLYCWGSGSGGWLGLGWGSAHSALPFYDGDTLPLGERVAEHHPLIRSFDSRFSVVRPQPVKYLTECGYAVDVSRVGGPVRAGSSHMILFCKQYHSGSRFASMGYSSAGDTTSNEEDEHEYVNYKGSFARPSSSNKGSIYAVNSATDRKATSPRRHANTIFNDDREPMAEVAPGKGSMMSVVEQLLNYCRQGDLTQVGRMLSSSHDGPPLLSVNSCDAIGNTPLIAACQSGQKHVCEFLVQRFGADLNQGNHRGNTPLHYCFNFGHEMIGQMLIDRGADEFKTNQHGLTCYEGLTHSDLERF